MAVLGNMEMLLFSQSVRRRVLVAQPMSVIAPPATAYQAAIVAG
jgi:hypothetical protein